MRGIGVLNITMAVVLVVCCLSPLTGAQEAMTDMSVTARVIYGAVCAVGVVAAIWVARLFVGISTAGVNDANMSLAFLPPMAAVLYVMLPLYGVYRLVAQGGDDEARELRAETTWETQIL